VSSCRRKRWWDHHDCRSEGEIQPKGWQTLDRPRSRRSSLVATPLERSRPCPLPPVMGDPIRRLRVAILKNLGARHRRGGWQGPDLLGRDEVLARGVLDEAVDSAKGLLVGDCRNRGKSIVESISITRLPKQDPRTALSPTNHLSHREQPHAHGQHPADMMHGQLGAPLQGFEDGMFLEWLAKHAAPRGHKSTKFYHALEFSSFHGGGARTTRGEGGGPHRSRSKARLLPGS
jgi:hypothetical protein